MSKKARDKKAVGIKLEDAVRQALEECIAENILAEFFQSHKEEIVEMEIWGFDQELHDQAMREDGEIIGMEKGIEIGKGQGIKMGIRIFQEILAGNTDNSVIAQASGYTVEEVAKVRLQLGM